MRKIMFGTLKHALRLLFYGAIGVVLTLLVVGVLHLNGRPDLSVWHTAHLDEEFTKDTDISSFVEYLALEERLFQQLDDEVYGESLATPGDHINRFSRGSLSDPHRWPQNWNRSYEMSVAQPRAAVLLLHGLSDSPYSLRNMAEKLHQQNAYVVGLRIPGHGTAPSGLVRTSWQDMAAAVRLAVKHLSQQNPNDPLYIIGYSNGAALALNFQLDALADPALPRADKLVLLSPEIAVTRLARFAKTQGRLGRLLGLEKLAWNDILPEYDPYKYGSFAVNAGKVSYEITREIQQQISQLTKTNQIKDLEPILAFSSVVDATVDVTALVAHLFNRLQPGGHELVLFDINRSSGVEQLLSWSPKAVVEALLGNPKKTFTLRLLSNENEQTSSVMLRTWSPGEAEQRTTGLGFNWPENIFSLTHVSLPFPAGDPLYGGEPESASPGIAIGALAMRGERGVLQISAADMLRLRWNPFYPYLEAHTLEFLGLE